MANPVARTLRAHSTDAEQLLWSALRGRRLQGWKFRRQVPIGRYIVDFCCLRARLVIEVDGGPHAAPSHRDADRTAWLEAETFRVIRFWNNVVLGNLEGVLQAIANALQQAPPPRPTPPRGEGDLLRDRSSTRGRR